MRCTLCGEPLHSKAVALVRVLQNRASNAAFTDNGRGAGQESRQAA